MSAIRGEREGRGAADMEGATQTHWLELLVAWAVVGVPALWGVAQVVEKSLALFR
jgi:hypothetical protein